MKASSPCRKSRIQSKIAKLPDAQRQQLHDWMKEGLIYSDIARRVRETFGVSISVGSLSTYYSKHAHEIHTSQPSGGVETLHLKLVLHVQILLELVHPAAKSDGN